MKRKSSKPNPKHWQQKIHSSSIRDIIGDRRFNNSGFDAHETEGTKRVKRVKIKDPEVDDRRNLKSNDSFVLPGAAEVPPGSSYGGFAAKTAEYAFFKRMKEKNTCVNAYPMINHQGNQKNDVVLSDNFTREIPNVQKESSKYAKSSVPVEKERHDARFSFLSPSCDKSKNSESNNAIGFSSLNVEKFKPGEYNWLSPSKASKSNTSGNKGVFSTKREKLLKWVADASFPDAGEHRSNGLDLVSVLLSRLLPESEYNCGRDTVLCQDIDSKHEPPFSESESDALNNRKLARKRNLMESDYRSYLDDGRSSTRLEDKEHFKWDSTGLEVSLVSRSAKANIQYKHRTTDGWKIPSFPTVGSSSSHEFLQRHETGGLQELDDLHIHNEPKFIELPRRPLLGWDDDSEKHDKELYACDSHSEMNTFSTATTSWHDYYHLSSPNRPVYYSSNTCFNSPLLPRYNLDSSVTPHVSRQFEEENYPSPLTLPCSPKRLTLIEDYFGENVLEGCSIKLPPQDCNWSFNEDLNEKEHRDLGSLLFSVQLPACDALGFLQNRGLGSFVLEDEDERNSLCSPDYFSEDRVNCYYSWSSNLEPSHEKHFGRVGCPLLLHNSSCDDSLDKIYNGDYTDEY